MCYRKSLRIAGVIIKHPLKIMNVNKKLQDSPAIAEIYHSS